MKKILIILFWFIGLIVSAQSKYWVDDDALNDLGAGSFADPFKTIGNAESHLSHGTVGGDTIYIHAGTYNERCVFNVSDGVSGNPHYVSNYNGEEVIIDGTGVDCSDTFLFLVYSSYINFQGLEIYNSEDGGGVRLGGTYCNLDSCKIHEIFAQGLMMTGGHNTASYDTIYNISMSNYHNALGNNSTTWPAGVSSVGASATYNKFSHCVVHDSWGEGIDLYGCASYNTVEYCKIYDVWSAMLYVSNVNNCLIQGNFVYQTQNWESWFDGSGYNGNGDGLSILDEDYPCGDSYNNRIINNIVYHTRRVNIGEFQDLFMANNTFVNGWSAIGSDYCVYFYATTGTGGAFRNNIIVQEDAVPCIYVPTGSPISFSYNLYNKAYDADAVGVGDVTDDPDFAGVGAVYDDTYYNILGTSPAINAGVNIYVYYDYLDSLRDDTPDIGAYEFAPADPPTYPTVITGSVVPWSRGARVISNLVSEGEGTVSAKGVCWSLVANPTTADSHSNDGTGTGYFNSKIVGLTKNTTYHYRAYATNETGTGYGNDLTFTTPPYSYIFIDEKKGFIQDKIGTVY